MRGRAALLAVPAAALLASACVSAPSPDGGETASDAPCAWAKAMSTERNVTSSVVVLVDRSSSFRPRPGSHRATALRNAVLEQAVLSFALAHGRLVSIGTFDGASTGTHWVVDRAAIPEATGTEDGNQVADRADARKCLENQIKDTLTSPGERAGTDVVGALSAAVRLLPATGGQRRLVVFTDGLGNAGCADLTVSQNPDQLLQACKPVLPTLDGVELTVLGLGRPALAAQGLSTGQDTMLRSIWDSFCRALGVTLPKGTTSCVGELDLGTDDDPAPSPADAAVALQELGVIHEPGRTVVRFPDALFDTDSAQLTPASQELIRRQVAALVREPYRSIQVEGHTDSRGTPEHNQKLSEDRAKAVAAALGLPGVTALGYGEKRLRCTAEFRNGVPDEACLAKNRRVEVTITKEGS